MSHLYPENLWFLWRLQGAKLLNISLKWVREDISNMQIFPQISVL